MDEVRRDDGELCGFVRVTEGAWRAETVFGVSLGDASTRDEATRIVLDQGLASLAERWLLTGPDGEEQIVCIQEASPDGVTLALGYYSMPGVPTLRVPRVDLDVGTFRLRPD